MDVFVEFSARISSGSLFKGSNKDFNASLKRINTIPFNNYRTFEKNNFFFTSSIPDFDLIIKV